MRPNAEVLAYYPTPLDHLPYVLEPLDVPPWANILDPCAGEGEFLQHLATELQATPRAVELNADRAAACSKRLAQEWPGQTTITGDAHRAKLGNFDIVYCNPPYMSEEKAENEGTQRAEIGFIRIAANALKPNGILIANINRNNLTIPFLTQLYRRFHKINIYNAPQNEWKQVYIYAYKRQLSTTVDQKELEELAALLADETFHLFPLSLTKKSYKLEEVGGKVRFAYDTLSTTNLINAARTAGITAKGIEAHLRPTIEPLELLMLPRTGHIPGVLTNLAPTLALPDGSLIRALVTADSTSEFTTEEQKGKTVNTTTTITEKTVAITRLFPDGTITSMDGVELAELINEHISYLTDQITEISKPLYDDWDYAGYAPIIKDFSPNRPIPGTQYSGLMPTQAHAVSALTKYLQNRRHGILAGKMGTGKTLMSTSIARLTNVNKVIVLCPPHLMGKWEEEIQAALPGTYTAQARRTSQAKKFFAREDENVSYLVMPSTAAINSGWTHAFVAPGSRGVSLTPRRGRGQTPKQTNQNNSQQFKPLVYQVSPESNDKRQIAKALYYQTAGYRCPNCGATARDSNKRVRDLTSDFTNRQHNCLQCHEPMWQEARRRRKTDKASINFKQWSIYATKLQRAIRNKTRKPKQPKNQGWAKTDLMAYIAEYYPGQYFLICDEVHEYASLQSSRGAGYRKLMAGAAKSISMTGTVTNGKASSLFALLYSTNVGNFRAKYRYNELNRFVQDHGTMIEKQTTTIHHNGSGTMQGGSSPREHAGISHGISSLMLPGTVYLELEDLGINIPAAKQIAVPVEMTPWMKLIYAEMVAILRPALADYLRVNSKALLSAYIYALQGWPNAVHRGRTVLKPNGQPLYTVPPNPDEKNPKLEALITDLQTDKKEGRRALIFFQQTDTLDIMDYYAEKLTQAGFKVEVCRVQPNKRREWFIQKEKEDIDAVLIHPRRVALGLDLVEWPSLNFFEQPKIATVFLQALARPRRLGQTKRITARHYVWEETLETTQLHLNAAKLIANATVEGAIPDPTMAALAKTARGNPVIALAKAVIEGDQAKDIKHLATILAKASATLDATGRVIEGADKLNIPTNHTPEHWTYVGHRISTETQGIVSLHRTPFGDLIVSDGVNARAPKNGEEFTPLTPDTPADDTDIATVPEQAAWPTPALARSAWLADRVVETTQESQEDETLTKYGLTPPPIHEVAKELGKHYFTLPKVVEALNKHLITTKILLQQTIEAEKLDHMNIEQKRQLLPKAQVEHMVFAIEANQPNWNTYPGPREFVYSRGLDHALAQPLYKEAIDLFLLHFQAKVLARLVPLIILGHPTDPPTVNVDDVNSFTVFDLPRSIQ